MNSWKFLAILVVAGLAVTCVSAESDSELDLLKKILNTMMEKKLSDPCAGLKERNVMDFSLREILSTSVVCSVNGKPANKCKETQLCCPALKSPVLMKNDAYVCKDVKP